MCMATMDEPSAVLHIYMQWSVVMCMYPMSIMAQWRQIPSMCSLHQSVKCFALVAYLGFFSGFFYAFGLFHIHFLLEIAM